MATKEDAGGLKCPNCGCAHHSVIETRQHDLTVHGVPYSFTRRKRLCRYCRHQWFTREHNEPENSTPSTPTVLLPKKLDLPPNPFV